MRKLRLILPAALAAGLLFMWGMQFASSAPHPAASVHASNTVRTDAIGHGAPVKTYFTTGDAGLAVTAGTPTALGAPVSITCPGTGKCKVEIENTVQWGSNATASNSWAVWEQQGSHVSRPGGPFMGNLPVDGSYQTGTEIEELNGVLNGTRLVQPLVYLTAGTATVYNYMIVIRVYAP
jgi:hypothetical protein